MPYSNWSLTRQIATKTARRNWKAANPGKRTYHRALPVSANLKPTDPRLASGALVEFGKFAGWTWSQVAAFDPSYCAWALSRPFVRQCPSLYARVRDALLVVLSEEQDAERLARLYDQFG